MRNMLIWLKSLLSSLRKSPKWIMRTERAHIRLLPQMEDNNSNKEDENVVDLKGFKDKKFYKVVAEDLDKVIQIVELTTKGLSMYQRYKQAAILRDQCIISLQILRQQLAHAKAVAEGKINGED